MSAYAYRLETLAKSICEELGLLTTSSKIKWQLEGQKYSATHNGLFFEIEDSGQNWLIVNRENGKNVATIMDTMLVHNVELLLQTVKHSLVSPTSSRAKFYDSGQTDLEEVLATLTREA